MDRYQDFARECTYLMDQQGLDPKSPLVPLVPPVYHPKLRKANDEDLDAIQDLMEYYQDLHWKVLDYGGEIQRLMVALERGELDGPFEGGEDH